MRSRRPAWARFTPVGNHYLGSSRKPVGLICHCFIWHVSQTNTITDDTSVKDVFLLRCPTIAPEDLTILYDFQLTNLDALCRYDSNTELGNGASPTSVIEIIRTPPQWVGSQSDRRAPRPQICRPTTPRGKNVQSCCKVPLQRKVWLDPATITLLRRNLAATATRLNIHLVRLSPTSYQIAPDLILHRPLCWVVP